MKDQLSITGRLKIDLFDSQGNLKQSVLVPNMVVDTGMDLIASVFGGASSSIATHMAVGEDGTTVTGSHTTLAPVTGSELARVALGSTNAVGNVITYSATFGAGVGTGAIQEAGIFNDPTAGTMVCRTTFSTINKAADDILTINWSVTFNYVV